MRIIGLSALEPEDCVRLTEPEDCIRAFVEKECGQYPSGNEVRGRCEIRIRNRAINELQTKVSIMQAIVQAGQKWMTRFGVDFEKDPEADVKL